MKMKLEQTKREREIIREGERKKENKKTNRDKAREKETELKKLIINDFIFSF